MVWGYCDPVNWSNLYPIALATLAFAACVGPDTPDAPACVVLEAQVPGPLAEARAGERDALAVAELFFEEAWLGGDDGFNTLAEQAVACARSRQGDTVAVRRALARLSLSFHRFSEAEARFRALFAETGDPGDAMAMGDALRELGRLDEAAEAYQLAVNVVPGPYALGRVGWLRQAWGDLEGAEQMWLQALELSDEPLDRAWVLGELGWLHAIQGKSASELDQAVSLAPTYARARLLRARIRIHAGDHGGAREDLALAGPGFDAKRALWEIDPSTDLEAACPSSKLGCGAWLAESDPARALALLDEERAARPNAVLRVAAAYAAFRLGKDTRDEVLAALESGTREPQTLVQAGLILGHQGLLEQALATGPGLFPSERARAEAALAALTLRPPQHE